MRFQVSFTIPASLLTTVVGVLTDEVQDLKIEQAARPEKSPRKGFPKKINGISLPQAILAAMADGKPKTIHALDAAAAKAGYSSQSASPATSDLVKAGKIIRLERGLYRLNGEAK